MTPSRHHAHAAWGPKLWNLRFGKPCENTRPDGRGARKRQFDFAEGTARADLWSKLFFLWKTNCLRPSYGKRGEIPSKSTNNSPNPHRPRGGRTAALRKFYFNEDYRNPAFRPRQFQVRPRTGPRLRPHPSAYQDRTDRYGSCGSRPLLQPSAAHPPRPACPQT